MIYRSLLTLLACAVSFSFGCGTAAQPEAASVNGNEFTRVKMANTETTDPNVEPAPVLDVKLESKILPGEAELKVKYSVTNNSPADIYLLDAYPGVDQATRTAFADLRSFYLSFREPETAFVLKGIPPLPSDKTVAVRVMPLGTKLEPGAKVDREFAVPLPMRERSDWYYPPLPPEEYSLGSIEKIIFNVQFIRSSVEGFSAQPAHYAEDFFVVRGNSTVKQAETLKVSFKIDKTQIFLRKDRFNRL